MHNCTRLLSIQKLSAIRLHRGAVFAHRRIMAQLKFVEAAEVKELITGPRKDKVQVVDVRDDEEFADGHINGAVNQPAATFADDTTVDEFITEQLNPQVETVVVHCMLSQVRGPKAAASIQWKRFTRQKSKNENMLQCTLPARYIILFGRIPDLGQRTDSFPKQPLQRSWLAERLQALKDAAPDGKQPEIVVLRNGFQGFQQTFGTDPEVINTGEKA